MERIYKGFLIRKVGSDWEVCDPRTLVVFRYCRTLRECKDRIDNQTL